MLALSVNNLTRTFTAPTGVTGWTKLDTVVADTMSTTVWTKVAQAGDPGASVRVPMSGTAKYTLTTAAYSEVDSTPALAFTAEADLTEHAVRSTPLVNAPPGSWLVSYWADKSSTTTAWTPEAAVTTRRASCAADGGRICSALADSAGAVPSGPNGNVTASGARPPLPPTPDSRNTTKQPQTISRRSTVSFWTPARNFEVLVGSTDFR